ncbi:hypothetical protein EYZ11_012701 [Aspergillus tanneri]|uniref:Uncharacterized protein n=1 Tax=Aspergillus tanneri TaxID=1220188 RepID=A0A4S3J033_9EURO|nr:hypothetical protein EYZ11_012701 [Aspergillus tanneri]
MALPVDEHRSDVLAEQRSTACLTDSDQQAVSDDPFLNNDDFVAGADRDRPTAWLTESYRQHVSEGSLLKNGNCVAGAEKSDQQDSSGATLVRFRSNGHGFLGSSYWIPVMNLLFFGPDMGSSLKC